MKETRCPCYCHSGDIPRKYEHVSHQFCQKFINPVSEENISKQEVKAAIEKANSDEWNQSAEAHDALMGLLSDLNLQD